MSVCLRLSLVVALFPYPIPGRAATIHQTIWQLPSEAAECYYIHHLVNKAARAVAEAEQLRREAEAAGGQAAIQRQGATQAFTVIFVMRRIFQAFEAVQAVDLKRGEVPLCGVLAREAAGQYLQQVHFLIESLQSHSK